MSVNRLDKYYTPQHIVDLTIQKTKEIIGEQNITEIIECAAGDGAFIESLKKAFPNIPQRYYDLYPEHPEIVKYDYKKLMLSYKKGRAIISNPPFGTSSSLWKAFCKKSAKIADYIVFISPASQYNSNYYFHQGELVFSLLLDDVEYRGSLDNGGKDQKVRTCLNIYKVYDREANNWREDKIKQIVKIGRTFREDGLEFDYYLAGVTSGKLTHCRICEKNDFQNTYGIKVLDEKYRTKIVEFINNFYQYSRELIDAKQGPPMIDNGFFTDKLKKYLFPTREERYNEIIEKAKSENRIRLKKNNTNYIYYENHHILPRCIGGSNEKENMQLLTAEEHYICHRLLTYIYPNNRGIILAFHYMMYGSKTNERIEIPVEDYAYLKELLSKNGMSIEQKDKISKTLTGVKHTEERIKKTNESNKGKTKGRKYPNRKRPQLTKEHKQHIKDSWTPRGYCKPKIYPEDDFSDYPEVRKPIKVERAIYAKELF